MEGKVCYFNGEFIKESEAKIHIFDLGLYADEVYEVGRTYNRVPFKLKEHVNRFFHSIRALPFLEFSLTPEKVIDITLELIKRNEKWLSQQTDCRYIHKMFQGLLPASPPRPTFYAFLHPYVLADYISFAKLYKEGAHLVLASNRQIPAQCLDPKIKHANRLCNRLAEYQAKMVDPEAVALMLDISGFAAECPTNSFCIVKEGKLLTSRLTNSLQSITRQTVLGLARELNIEFLETDLSVYDLYNADEIMIASTGFAIVPVSKFNGRLLPKPIPGTITKRLQSAFSEKAGYDIVQRALAYSQSKRYR
jgi:branched-chain amino acid aminotransferase